MTGLYIVTQVVGGMVGVWAANVRTLVWQLSATVRTGPGQWFAEAVATFGLGTIFGTVAHARSATSYAVGLYITSAYWFTASTSFANPAGSRNNDCIAFATMVDLATMIKMATMIDLAITTAVKIRPLFKGSRVMTLRHISILLYVLPDTRWGRRDHATTARRESISALHGEAG
jgi:hypothetical protein